MLGIKNGVQVLRLKDMSVPFFYFFNLNQKYTMSKEKAKEIIEMLNKTLSKLSKSDGMYSDNAMFKRPKAKRSDITNKIKELEKKYKL